jgi:geranylgeranyl reductase family protein
MPPEEIDVAVIGAGPAGSSCAAELAAHGYSVALIDKEDFPREKTCGDGLTPQALTALRNLGLDTLVNDAQPIEGCRVVMDHRREHLGGFDDGDRGACLPRSVLDNAILEVARERGAHFQIARAQGIRFDRGSDVGRVVLAGDDGKEILSARRIVAADGPTSVIRRSIGLGTPGHAVRAFAIRGYFETERELDPVFDVYLPLEVQGTTLIGYGWVFRTESHIANIGVGYFRPGGIDQLPPLNVSLTAFVAELATRQRRRFGDIKSLTRASGSPLGLNFAPACCTRGNLLLVGDAAGITDPFTGEGIALAINAGISAAETVHGSLGRGAPMTDFGLHLARRLTRSGQDYSSMARVMARHESNTDGGTHRINRLEFLSSAIAIAADMNLTTEPGDTDVENMLRELDADGGEVVTAVHERLLDSTTTTFPFTRALISRQMRSRGGPVYAAMLVLTVRAYGEDVAPEELVLAAGQAAECLAPFHLFLSELGGKTSGELEKLNNGLAVMAADFVISQAVLAISRLGAGAAAELARTARSTCEAGIIDASEQFDLDRSAERYLLAAEKGMGSALAFAAGLGAELAGCGPDATSHIRRYGQLVGIAQRISADIGELERVRESRRDLAKSLRFGRYGLPLLMAFQRDPALRRTVTAGPARDELADFVDAVRATGALEAAQQTADQFVDDAKAELVSAAAPTPERLIDFASWFAPNNRIAVAHAA